VPLLGLRADGCSGRPADDRAGSHTARSACQHAAENAAHHGASCRRQLPDPAVAEAAEAEESAPEAEVHIRRAVDDMVLINANRLATFGVVQVPALIAKPPLTICRIRNLGGINVW
jgi:hypothetical protein